MPDSWTSINGATLDWTYELQLHDYYDVLEAPRQAIIERSSALYKSQADIPITLLVPIPRLSSLYGYVTDLELAITTLLSYSKSYVYFVNHTDNGGDWHGSPAATGIPPWTRTTMMAAIGESRIFPNNISVIGAWAKQQYKILNLLRWAMHSWVGGSNTIGWAKGGGGSTWGGAVTAYNAATWGSASYAIRTRSFFYNGGYSVDICKGYCSIMPSCGTTCKASCTFYGLPVVFSSSYSYNSPDGWPENCYINLGTNSERAILYGVRINSDFIFEMSMQANPYPLLGYLCYLHSGSDPSLRQGGVLKFDGANGFKFIV